MSSPSPVCAVAVADSSALNASPIVVLFFIGQFSGQAVASRNRLAASLS
jgi:hypothetical protein